MAGYCTVTEIGTLGTKAEALSDIEVPVQQSQIDVNAGLIDNYLRQRYVLPLLGWGLELRRANAVMAAYDCITGTVGVNPEGADEILQVRYDAVIAWLKMIAQGTITPDVTDSSPTGGTASAKVVSASSRGFSNRGTGEDRLPFQSD